MVAVFYLHVHEALRVAVPEFGPSIDEHIAVNGEVLPHVLFGELTRFVLAAHERDDGELTERCLAFLDLALRDGDPMVTNLFAVSFVENLSPWSAAAWVFIESWPEGLRAEAQRQHDWRPGTA